jgi:ribose/xylose/arabinose/galactoside ABC-type transport system permease subunit
MRPTSTRTILNQFAPPNGRPVWILAAAILALAIADHGTGQLLRWSTLFSVSQLFATFGLVALGLGLTMMLHEYDLSVAGSFALAGIVAVLTGGAHPLLGLFCGVVVGVAAGALQGGLIVLLRLPSVGLTLGGLLILLGLTYVLTGGSTVAYANRDVSRLLQEPVLGGCMSWRGALVSSAYIVLALVFAFTRVGRDIIATGSNRVGAGIAGVPTSKIIVGVFAAAGGLAALGGSLLSYSLAAASAEGLSDVLVPATAAAIIGGVSLGGGKGRPIGIACGVLTLCLLRSGMSALGAPPFVLDTVTGLVLLVVAVIDAPLFSIQIHLIRKEFLR